MKLYPFLFLILFSCTASEESRIITSDHALTTYFGQQKFKISGQTGLTGTCIISTPGSYALSEDIPSNAASGQAISITSSNVILDLSGRSITFAGGTGTGINGITVAANLSNITIRNGIISGMNGSGVLINSGCLNINLEQLDINGCTTAGVNFAGTATTPLSGCSLTECHIRQCNGGTNPTYGVKLTYCNFLTATNCSFNSNTATTAAQNCYGFYAIASQGSILTQCDARGNSATALAAGFYLDTGCSGTIFQQCTAHLNTSTATTNAGKAFGFYEQTTNNNRFELCKSFNNSAYAFAAGFYGKNCSFNYWLNCSSYNNVITGTTGTAGGFGFICDTAPCEGNIFDQCIAFSNKGSTDSASFGCGFLLDNSTNSTIKGCTSQGNDGQTGTGVGIYIKSGCSRCCVQNNSIIANSSNTLAKAYGYWDASTPSTTLMTGNVAFANRDTTILPTNQNYVTIYTNGSAIQSTAKNSLKTLNIPTFTNTDITP